MDASLRYESGQIDRQFSTVLDFASSGGILRAAEQCNGSGDCRKSHLMGGTMCPSFMATRNERDTTRARANILREVLTRSPKANPFDSEEIAAVMDLCLSCKGCKSECPSNVDVARLKAEWLQQYYDARGVPWRSKLIAGFSTAMAAAQLVRLLRFLPTRPARVVSCHMTFRIDACRFASVSTDNTPVGITLVGIMQGPARLTLGALIAAWPAAVHP